MTEPKHSFTSQDRRAEFYEGVRAHKPRRLDDAGLRELLVSGTGRLAYARVGWGIPTRPLIEDLKNGWENSTPTFDLWARGRPAQIRLGLPRAAGFSDQELVVRAWTTEFKSGPKQLLVWMATNVNKQGIVKAALARIAVGLGCTRDTVRDRLKTLEQAGAIRTVHKGGGFVGDVSQWVLRPLRWPIQTSYWESMQAQSGESWWVRNALGIPDHLATNILFHALGEAKANEALRRDAPSPLSPADIQWTTDLNLDKRF